MNKMQCSHDGCSCEFEPAKAVARGGKNYCSQPCADSTAGKGANCSCGHAGCQPVASKSKRS